MTETILAFDTSLPQISAAVLHEGKVIAAVTEEMARGQAERLMPLVQELLAGQNLTFGDLTAVAVGVGPGNFTGIRISVSAARGLALGLGIPAVGVTAFEAMLPEADPFSDTLKLLTIDAPRGQIYAQHYRGNAAADDAILTTPDDLAPLAERTQPNTQSIAERIAHIAALRLADPAYNRKSRPAPLYVRAADAAPSRDAAPVILAG